MTKLPLLLGGRAVAAQATVSGEEYIFINVPPYKYGLLVHYTKHTEL